MNPLRVCLLVAMVLQWLLIPLLPIAAEPRAIRAGGVVLIALGLITAVVAAAGPKLNPSTRLYRNIRYPHFLADILLVAGCELALNSWLWLLVLPVTAFLWRTVTRQDSALAAGLDGNLKLFETSGLFLPRNVAVGLAAAAMAFAFQFANVNGNFGGNWSALYCTGSSFPPPASLTNEDIHLFPASNGYDGQFYHYIAHDPWPAGELAKSVDAPRLRYTRILVPALVHILAFGQQPWIDPVFHAVSIFTFGLGAWWLACYAQLMGANRYLGLLFLLIPAVLISMERVTVDLMFLALCCGFAYYAAQRATIACYVVVTLAMLTRDTGYLLWGAYGLWLLINRRWWQSVLFGTSAVPAVIWLVTVRAHTLPAEVPVFQSGSGNALWNRLFTPNHYQLAPALAATANALDYISLAGIILAIVLTVVFLIRHRPDPSSIAGLAFAALPLVLGRALGWDDAVAYPRTLSPLLLFLALTVLNGNSRLALVPMLLVLPRLTMLIASKLPGAAYLLQR